MAASIALNSAVNIDEPKSTVLGGLWGRVQKVRENITNLAANISREDIVRGVQQVRHTINNISRQDIVDHVKKVGTNLRDMSATDRVFLGLSMGAGLGAKALAFGALGVASGGTTVAAALIGGAAVGVAKVVVKQIQNKYEGKSSDAFLSGSTAKSIAISAGVSVLTMGTSDALGAAFKSLTGDTFGHTLSGLFHKATDNLPKTLFAAMPMGSLHAQTADLPNIPRGVPIPAADAPLNVPRAVAIEPAPAASAAPNIPRAVPITPVETPVNVPRAVAIEPAPVAADVPNVPRAVPIAPVETPVNVPRAVAIEPAPVVETPVEAPVAAPKPIPTPAPDKYFGPNKNIEGGTLERARAWMKSLQPAAKIAVPDAPVAPAPVQAPVAVEPTNVPKPVAVKAPSIIVDEKETSLDRARRWMAEQNGVKAAAPAAAVPPVTADKIVNLKDIASADLGKDANNIVLNTDNGVRVKVPAAPNVDAEIKTVNAAIRESVASGGEPLAEIDPRKVAAVCAADLPSSEAAFNAQGRVLPNHCVIVDGKMDMAEGDVVLVRDTAEAAPSAKRGLRALTATFAEKTVGFIGRTVTGETLQNMFAEKLATTAPAP